MYKHYNIKGKRRRKKGLSLCILQKIKVKGNSDVNWYTSSNVSDVLFS